MKHGPESPWLFRVDDGGGIIKEISPGVDARIFTGEHSMVSIVTIEPYSQHEIHSPPQEQWGLLLAGECVRILSICDR